MLLVPDVAVIVVVCGNVPLVAEVNTPELSMVPALEFDDAQLALEVMSWTVPSDKVALAVNRGLLPRFMVEFCGVTAIETMFPSVTVTVVEPLIVAGDPTETPVASPVELTLTTVESELDQEAMPVKSFLVLSSYVPVVDICLVLPSRTEGVAGVTLTDESVGLTKNPPHPAPSARIAISPLRNWGVAPPAAQPP
jgi:hypothetical protein